MHATTRRLVQPVLLACTLAAGCAPPALDAPPLPASGLHRVVASGPAADALVAAGATVVAEYEAFRVLDAGPHALQASQALADGKVELRNDFLRIHLNSGDVDTSLAPASRALRAAQVGAEDKALRLVQFTAPVRPEWLARLEATGVRVVGHVPANAYLVYGDTAALERFGSWAFAASEVQYDGDYLPAHKLDRALAPSGPGSYAVQLVEDPAVNEATLALARARETKPGHVARALGYVNLVVHADRAAADALAARPDVVSVQPFVEPTLLDERQDIILTGQTTGGLPNAPGYLPWLAARGFTQAQFDASAFGVDVTDSGIDNALTTPDGLAAFDDLLVDRAGTYVLGASSGSLAMATGEAFDASPAPPQRAVFIQQPQNVVAGVALQPPPQVLLLDRFDNPALQATTTVSLALAANPAGGRLLGELAVAAVAGVATFGDVSIDKVGTPYALYAGASGLSGDTSVGFEVQPGPAAGFSFSGPSVASAGVEVVYDLSAVDAGSNPVAGYAGVATATSTDAAATLPAPVTFGAGLAQGVHVTFWTSGTQTLTFTDSAAAMTGSVTVTVVSGGPTGPTGPAGAPGADGGCSSGGGGAASGLAFLALAWIRRRGGREARRCRSTG